MMPLVVRVPLLLSVYPGVNSLHYSGENGPDGNPETVDLAQDAGVRFGVLPDWKGGTAGEVDYRCYEGFYGTCPLDATLQDANDTVLKHQTLLSSMRTACLGHTWDGSRCWSLLRNLRGAAYGTVRKWSSGDQLHVASMCAPPPVLHFRTGGGMKASIPCGGKNGKNHAFFFRHNYKVAGFAIKANLCALANTPWTSDDDWYDESRCREYQEMKKISNPTLFTFVRNPISKFVSGYKELCVRGVAGPFIHGFKAGSIQHAKGFLDRVFHGTCDNPHVLSQVYLLTGNECESKFDFIGKLENFAHDWVSLGKGWCEKDLRWLENPEHDSQNPADAKYEVAMQKALRDNGNKLFKALCWWLLSDFALFDYDLPPECASDQDLSAALEFHAKKG